LAAKCYNVASTVLGAITDEDIQKASLLQKGTFSAMMVDKARLAEGESTDNILLVQADLRKDQDELHTIEAELAELEDKLD